MHDGSRKLRFVQSNAEFAVLLVISAARTVDSIMEEKQPQQGGAYPPQGGAYPPQGGAYPPQGGAYPPQGGAYPPQSGAYPPQGGAYPPQGGAYPPQGGAYPPQGGAYPPQGGAYPPQGGAFSASAPPPYYPQVTSQQQMGTSVVVVQSQPTVTTAVFTPVGDYYYTVSVVLSFLCFFCGSWWSLCCTIPAIFVASAARDAAARGDLVGARRSGQTALGLNIAAVVSYVIIWAVIIGLAAGIGGKTRSCYSSYNYNYYKC